MESQKTLEVLLKFGLDNERAKAARAELGRVEAEFKKLQQSAELARARYDELFKKGIKAEGLLDVIADAEAEMKKLGDAARKTKEELDDALNPSKKQQEYIADLNKTREAAEKLEGVSLRVGAAGLAILQGYQQLGQNYADKMGNATAASQRWLKTSQDLEQSQLRLGAVAANALNPMREKLAQITESFASLAEISPLPWS